MTSGDKTLVLVFHPQHPGVEMRNTDLPARINARKNLLLPTPGGRNAKHRVHWCTALPGRINARKNLLLLVFFLPFGLTLDALPPTPQLFCELLLPLVSA